MKAFFIFFSVCILFSVVITSAGNFTYESYGMSVQRLWNIAFTWQWVGIRVAAIIATGMIYRLWSNKKSTNDAIIIGNLFVSGILGLMASNALFGVILRFMNDLTISKIAGEVIGIGIGQIIFYRLMAIK